MYQKLQENCPRLSSIEQAVELALLTAYNFRKKGNKGRGPWTWGELHTLQFRHILGVNPVLGHIFNGPKLEVGGDTDTVFQTAFIPQQPYESEAWCPSFRQVVELDPRPEAVGYHCVLPTGQSGHPGSENYLDQFPLWARGQTRTYDQGLGKCLTLKPE